MQEIIKKTGQIKTVHCFELHLEQDFLQIASRFSSLPGTVLLLSGGTQDSANYNILGLRPWLWLKSKNQNIQLSTAEHKQSFQADPLDVLDKLLSYYSISQQAPDLPLEAGLLGCLAYDLNNRLEDLPRTTMDDLGLPDLCLFAPQTLLLQDLASGKYRLCLPELENTGSWSREKEFFLQALQQPAPELEPVRPKSELASNFQHSQYLQSIEKIREYIKDGHVYQVNLAQRFKLEFQGSAFSLLQTLFKRNPAPFFAYLNCSGHQIISSSPERFLLKRNNYVESRPIKGTRPRGQDQGQDQANAHELLHSPKDDAELSMIVDLLRNDLGKVCQAGSVQVREHKRLEEYQNVFHLVSIIQGELAPDKTCVDLLRAAFPGGSITGCPKVRAMEIIDELEPNPRHVYTGSLGYFSFAGDMDLSIAIRTATICGSSLAFSVGGGIVFDSDPELEFEETLHKGQTLMQAFYQEAGQKQDKPEYIWQNGQILPAGQAMIPACIPGFEYGFGLFETMLASQGRVLDLEEHLQRLHNSWLALWGTSPPDISWKSVISQVLKANALHQDNAAVKILAAKGAKQEPLFDDQLLVRARPHQHRLQTLQKNGLDLLTHPEPRQNWLAEHKSMNHLYYYLAGQWARSRGADEALILNPDRSVSETNSANLFCVSGSRLLVPVSAHVLPGVMQEKALQVLQKMGFALHRKRLRPEDLGQADCVLLTNSLLGAVQVLSLDQNPLQLRPDLVQDLNRRLFPA